MGLESSSYAGGMRTSQYDYSKIFIFGNSFADGQINNSTYDDVTHPIGTLMGRVSATGLLVPCATGASDGSQYPVGVLADEYTVPDGETINVRICTAGEVDENKIVFDGSDDFDTVVESKTMRDRIGSDTVGIVLKSIDELGAADNE